MTRGRASDRVVGHATRIYATLLRALPATFRDRNGSEMTALFRELASEAGARGSAFAVLGCLARESADLLTTAVRLRFARRPRVHRSANTSLARGSVSAISHLSEGSSGMETLRQDLAYALRAVVRRPGFTIVAVLTLGLGIGATTAIFSVVNSVILRPLPYPDADRLTMVWRTIPAANMTRAPHSYPNFVDYRQSARSFEALAAYRSPQPQPVLIGGETELRFGMRATASLFDVLGIAPAEGRRLLPSDDQAGAPRVVILSHAFAERLAAGSGSMVGKQVIIDRVPHTVVGVMPEDFAYPNKTPEFWAPIVATGEDLSDRDTNFLTVIGRLRAGVQLVAAQAEMDRIRERLAVEHPTENANGTGLLLEQRQKFVTGDVRPVMFILLGAVGFVLAIACANLANLILARGSARRREFAVRMALGASRQRLIRQLLTESLLLAALGALLGVAIAYVGTRLLVEFGPPALPRRWEIGIDPLTLVFTTLIALVSGVASGLFPAYRFSRPDLQDDLKGGAQGAARVAGHRVQRALVVVQVALALVLLIGAGLLANSLMRLMTVDPGFDPKNVLAVRISPAADRYTEAGAIDALYDRLVERVATIPGVVSVSAAYAPPFSAWSASTAITIEGQEVRTEDRPLIVMLPVRGNYVETMKLRLVEGRPVGDDDRADGLPVVVINEGMAKRFWPGQSAVGKRFRRGTPQDNRPWQTVVGVVGDVKESLDTIPGLQGYWPHSQSAWARDMAIVVRTSGDPLSLVNAVRAQVRSADAELPIVSTNTLEKSISESVAQPRFRTVVVLSFAGAACLLALVGIYGVMAFVVAERTREIGVRMALGAEQGGVLRFVLGQGFRLTVLGIVIGVVGAVAATRVIRTMLFGIGTTDPLTYGLVIVALGAVAMLACWVPARRASRVDPLVALRTE